MKFVASSQPPEGLGVLILFRLIEDATPAFFHPERRLWVARAPGRLDVMGGAASRVGAPALQLPIAEAACAAIQARDDELLRVWSPTREGHRSQRLSTTLGDLGLRAGEEPGSYADARAFFAADPRDRWAAYLLGSLLVLARERGLRPTHGFELLLHSDVPEGRGVASSSAITVATLRALGQLYGVPLEGSELAALCQIVEREVAGAASGAAEAITAACAEADEVLSITTDAGGVTGSASVPEALEFVGIDSGVMREAALELADAVTDAAEERARTERFAALLRGPITDESRRELGELMFAAHAAHGARGLGHATTDFLVELARQRRDAGGPIVGAKATGHGGGGTVVLLGERGKVWLEALRLKKALLGRSGHSAHIFRWSSPGASSFGTIELVPANG